MSIMGLAGQISTGELQSMCLVRGWGRGDPCAAP